MLVVAGLLVMADRRWRMGHGRVFALYVALYALGRLPIELLRIDPANDVLGLRVNVWISMLTFVGAVTYLVVSARRSPGRESSGGARGSAASVGVDRPTGGKAVSEKAFEIHHAHRDVTGGWLRPAVFGASDGLVSNFALIAGVAGGAAATGADSTAVVIAGLAGLVAGAASMAAGEYVSVASQSELAEAEIELERRELVTRPEAEQKELAETFRRRGLSEELAGEVARELSRDPVTALEVHVREELGVDVHDLPSPMTAAVSSFLSFSLGALIPLLPYLFGAESLAPALVVSFVALFGVGVLVSQVTVRTWLFSGTRQLLLGAVAAGITYLVGSLVGAGIG